MADDTKTLAEFQRNAEDTLRVSLSTFKGRTYVDVRLFYTSDTGELLPTKKGVTVTPDLWDAFRAAIAAAEAELQARNLWHPEASA
ncbi:MAG: transcriptional coactivator p15/PC4 family protein [Acidobacteriia bacterium]|nr:transcriptional coactivator p15/PC4 family protein [Terriglobia bacterium]